MHLLVAPRQFAQRSELYHQLAQFTTAGLPLIQALEMLSRNPPARSFRDPLQQTVVALNQGFTLAEALRCTGSWLPSFDLALLEAAEQSGRLDAVFRLLAAYYRDRAALARQILSAMAYPAFLLHFGIFIFPFPRFFLTGNTAAYLAQTLGVLLPMYVVIALAIYAAQSRHGERWRAAVEAILHPIPLLGSARRSLALARLAAALEALMSAGAPVIEAWELAAAASGSPALRRAVLAWKPAVLAGQTPAEAVGASRQFPELFANLYATGEMSGQLDDALRRLCAYYHEEGARKLQFVAAWTPKFVYLLVVGMIIWRVIDFYTDYFRQIQQAGGF